MNILKLSNQEGLRGSLPKSQQNIMDWIGIQTNNHEEKG